MSPEAYRNRWLKIRERYERRGRGIFRRAIRQCTANLTFDNLDPFRYPFQIDISIPEEPIRKAYEQFFLEIGLDQGKRILRGVEREIRQDQKRINTPGFEPYYADEVAKWIAEHGGKKIVSVRKGLVNEVIRLIARRVQEGGRRSSIQDITRELESTILSRGFFRWQIERIVRTETTAASNFGALRAGQSSRIMTGKQWISSHNGRTRRIGKGDLYDHYVMHKRITDDINTPFRVPGARGDDLLDYPGDPKGQAANVINCRCAVAVVPIRDANGKLIFLRNGGARPRIPVPKPPPPKPPPPPPKPKPKPKEDWPKIIPGQARGPFVPAKSEFEAAQRITDMIQGPVSLKGLNSKQYNALLDIVEQEHAFSSLAGLKGGLKFYETVPKHLGRKMSRANAWYYPGRDEINFVRRSMKDKVVRVYWGYHDQRNKWQRAVQELQDRINQYPDSPNTFAWERTMRKYQKQADKMQSYIDAGLDAHYWSNSSMEADGLKAMQTTMIHEIGHYRHFNQLRHRKFKFRKANSLTEYGQTDMDEYMTEWYTYWRKGGYEGIIPKDLLEAFKELPNITPR